mgnify:FL=1
MSVIVKLIELESRLEAEFDHAERQAWIGSGSDIPEIKIGSIDPGSANLGRGIFWADELSKGISIGIFLPSRFNLYGGENKMIKTPTKVFDTSSWTRTELKCKSFVRQSAPVLKQLDVVLVERQMSTRTMANASETTEIVNVGAQMIASAEVCARHGAIRNDPGTVAAHFSYLFPKTLIYHDRRGTQRTKTLPDTASAEDRRKFNKMCAIHAARECGILTKSELRAIDNRLKYLRNEAQAYHQRRLDLFDMLCAEILTEKASRKKGFSEEERAALNEDFSIQRTYLKPYEIKEEEDDFIDPVFDVAEFEKVSYGLDILERRQRYFQNKTSIRYLIYLSDCHDKSIQRWRRIDEDRKSVV